MFHLRKMDRMEMRYFLEDNKKKLIALGAAIVVVICGCSYVIMNLPKEEVVEEKINQETIEVAGFDVVKAHEEEITTHKQELDEDFGKTMQFTGKNLSVNGHEFLVLDQYGTKKYVLMEDEILRKKITTSYDTFLLRGELEAISEEEVSEWKLTDLRNVLDQFAKDYSKEYQKVVQAINVQFGYKKTVKDEKIAEEDLSKIQEERYAKWEQYLENDLDEEFGVTVKENIAEAYAAYISENPYPEYLDTVRLTSKTILCTLDGEVYSEYSDEKAVECINNYYDDYFKTAIGIVYDQNTTVYAKQITENTWYENLKSAGLYFMDDTDQCAVLTMVDYDKNFTEVFLKNGILYDHSLKASELPMYAEMVMGVQYFSWKSVSIDDTDYFPESTYFYLADYALLDEVDVPEGKEVLVNDSDLVLKLTIPNTSDSVTINPGSKYLLDRDNVDHLLIKASN